MINFSDGVKHLYLRKLNEVSQKQTSGLNQWLTNGADYYVPCDQQNNDFTIGTYNPFDFLNPYSYDINRLSCAATESLRDIGQISWQHKFIGWNITKFYYSAFFSAHCILKIMGKSLSNIDQSSINRIKDITTLYGYRVGNLNNGLYCISVDTVNNRFRFYKVPKYDNSHEGLWCYFTDFLNDSKNSVYHQLPQHEAQIVVEKIDELIKALRNWNSPHGNWLSRIRNLVNYNQAYGTWYPYKGYNAEYDRIYTFLNLHKNNPLTIDIAPYAGKDILYFVRTCQLINAISNDLLCDLETKHPTNKSFVKTGIKQFESLYA